MKMNLFSHLSGNLGYNVHAQGLAEGLIENGVDLRCVLEEQRLSSKISSNLLESIRKGYSKDAPSVRLGYGHDMCKFTGSKRVALSVWETTKIPKDWVEPMNACDDVWTVSEFCKKTFEDSGVTHDVKVVPEAVDTTIFHPFVKPIERPKDEFLFLSIFKWEARKSPDILLQAFAEEFKPGEKVRLGIQPFNPFIQNFEPYQALFNLNLPCHAPISVFPVTATRPEVARYFRSSDCFVFPSKGESWGLPAIESMACGVPVITTNWGGTPEFVNDKYGWLIDVDHMEEPDDKMFFRPEMFDGKNEWAVPSKKHLRELMRYAFEHPDECKKKGDAAWDNVDKNHNWKKATKKIPEYLKGIQ